MMLFWSILVFFPEFAALSEAGNDASGNECAKVRNAPEKWVTPPSCFRLLASDDITKAMSCISITSNFSGSEIHHGSNLEDVQGDYSFLMALSIGLVNLFSSSSSSVNNRTSSVCLSPYEDLYVRVKCEGNADEKFEIIVDIIPDRICIACVLVGTALFFMAEKLSKSIKFYYASGVSIGMLASLLILVFLLSRLVPKKPAAYTILLGGWSVVAWVLRLMWNNWQELLKKYNMYFLIYIGVTGFCSFAFCYLWGPMKDPRSQNVIKWAIQILAFFLIYNGTQLPTASITLLVVVTVSKFLIDGLHGDINMWSRLKKFLCLYIWRTSPTPRRLLSKEEYRKQGEEETRKALEELREYCSSPHCSPWKTLSRIKTPDKFVKFMDGENHVTDAEMTMYDAELSDSDQSGLITDDENETYTSCSIVPTSRAPASAKTEDPYISEDES